MKWLLLLLLIPALAWAHPCLTPTRPKVRCVMAEVDLPVIQSGTVIYDEFLDEYSITSSYARLYDDFDAGPVRYRAHFVFNTALIPADATIASAKLYRVIAGGYPAGAGSVIVSHRVSSTAPAANSTFYNGGTSAGAETLTSGSSATAEIDFNAAGIAAINRSGNTTVNTLALFTSVIDTVYTPGSMELRIVYALPTPRNKWPFKAAE